MGSITYRNDKSHNILYRVVTTNNTDVTIFLEDGTGHILNVVYCYPNPVIAPPHEYPNPIVDNPEKNPNPIITPSPRRYRLDEE